MSKVTNRQLAEVIVAQLGAGHSMNKVARSLAGYLVAEHRSKDHEVILRLVEQVLAKKQGQVELKMVSAYKLSDAIRKELSTLFQDKTKAKHVIINEVIDPQVIGGVLVESAEQRLDLTVRRQLQRLKEMGV